LRDHGAHGARGGEHQRRRGYGVPDLLPQGLTGDSELIGVHAGGDSISPLWTRYISLPKRASGSKRSSSGGQAFAARRSPPGSSAPASTATSVRTPTTTRRRTTRATTRLAS